MITRIDGALKAIFPQKKGTNDKGEWAVQSLILAQGNDSIKVSAWNLAPVSENDKGKPVSVVAFKGQKGWSGVYANTGKDKDGNPQREIRLTKTANIIIGGASAPQSPANAPEPADDIPMDFPPKNPPQSAPTPKPAINAPFHHSATLCWALGQSILTMNAIGTDWLVDEKQLWQRASTLLRAHDALAAGKLAPKPEKTTIAPEDVPQVEPEGIGF